MESTSRPVPISADQLLAIVEVNREDRVLCQQPGCGQERLAALSRRRSAPHLPLLTWTSHEQARSAVGFGHVSPWPWVKPLASMAYFQLRDGTNWTRLQHRDGRQLLVPYPMFDGWDEALPASIGTPNFDLQALDIADLRSAVAYLRRLGDPARVGIWRDIASNAIKQHSKR